MNNNERDDYIRAKLQEHYDEAVSLGHEIFCLVLQGSQNYGLDIYGEHYKSDIDTKCIVLPFFDDFCVGRSPISTTHERQNKEHIDIKDIRVMFDTFKKQNINFVEILFSKYYIVPEKYRSFWLQLQSIAEELTHCHPAQNLKTMAGMSFEKKKALCHPYPTIVGKIEKYGYDGKQLHHIIRINEFIKNYISGVPFAQCLTAHSDMYSDMLTKSKLNLYTLSEALKMADEFDNENNDLKNTFIAENGCELLDATPYQKLDAIKIKVLRQWFKEQLR